ncbi:hypothetical protein [Spartinivicinus poritis]|uniref:Uncharacterized protein n=1 Tax=Spartinivicinus poritis TaxID=2994640 RepID=A0ABT5UGK2_9GAMM|nr:hypothetical protein [Spartinivicinus sp. A2-2]MDE1465488.1 hypothetical protein [Spartinivicinus sp. A2-2]
MLNTIFKSSKILLVGLLSANAIASSSSSFDCDKFLHSVTGEKSVYDFHIEILQAGAKRSDVVFLPRLSESCKEKIKVNQQNIKTLNEILKAETLTRYIIRTHKEDDEIKQIHKEQLLSLRDKLQSSNIKDKNKKLHFINKHLKDKYGISSKNTKPLPKRVLKADINNDYQDDIVVRFSDGAIMIIYPNDGGTKKPTIIKDAGKDYTILAITDHNNDGYKDALLYNAKENLLYNYNSIGDESRHKEEQRKAKYKLSEFEDISHVKVNGESAFAVIDKSKVLLIKSSEL